MSTTGSLSTSEAAPFNRKAIALTMASVFFLLLLDSSILNTSLPRVAESMGVQPLALSPTITGYLLASVAAMPLSDWLSNRFGPRRLFLTSILVFTVASGACGVSATLAQLIVARIVQGASAGLMLTVGRTVAIKGAEKTELLAVSNLLIWPALFAPVVGPPIGGWITTYLSWRWNFLLNVPLGLVGLWASSVFMPRDGSLTRDPLDWRGALLTVAGLGATFGGLELAAQAPERGGDAWWPAIGLTAVGVGLMVMAVRHLTSVPKPLVSLIPLREQTFAMSTFGGGVFATLCLHATPYLLPLMWQIAYGGTAAAAGAMLFPYFLGNLAIKTVVTRLLRGFGFKQIVLFDGMLAMLSIAACGLLSPETSWVVLSICLFVAGASRSTLFTALNTLAFADVAHQERGAAATLFSVSTLLSQSLGIVVSTLLLAAATAIGGRQEPSSLEFLIAFAAVGAIGVVAVLRFVRLPGDAGQDVSGHRGGARTP